MQRHCIGRPQADRPILARGIFNAEHWIDGKSDARKFGRIRHGGFNPSAKPQDHRRATRISCLARGRDICSPIQYRRTARFSRCRQPSLQTGICGQAKSFIGLFPLLLPPFSNDLKADKKTHDRTFLLITAIFDRSPTRSIFEWVSRDKNPRQNSLSFVRFLPLSPHREQLAPPRTQNLAQWGWFRWTSASASASVSPSSNSGE